MPHGAEIASLIRVISGEETNMRMLLQVAATLAFAVPAAAAPTHVLFQLESDVESYNFYLPLPLHENDAPGTGIDGDISPYDFGTRVFVYEGGIPNGPEIHVPGRFAYVGFSGQLVPEELGFPTRIFLIEGELGPLAARFTADRRVMFGENDITVSTGVFSALRDDGVLYTLRIAEVPEPAAVGLFGLGALALALRRRRAKWCFTRDVILWGPYVRNGWLADNNH